MWNNEGFKNKSVKEYLENDFLYAKFSCYSTGVVNFSIKCNVELGELIYRYYDMNNEKCERVIKLDAVAINELKPYIRVSNFEKYRSGKIQADDTISYLDGWYITFEGYSNTYVPYIRLESSDYGINLPQPPVEALVNYIEKTYKLCNKEYKKKCK